jgi:hypothetical protein
MRGSLKGYLFTFTVMASNISIAYGQTGPGLVDPTEGGNVLFGLGGHACKLYDDTNRLYLYPEGFMPLDIAVWLQQSDHGAKPNIPMPQILADALPKIHFCLPGKHHS